MSWQTFKCFWSLSNLCRRRPLHPAKKLNWRLPNFYGCITWFKLAVVCTVINVLKNRKKRKGRSRTSGLFSIISYTVMPPTRGCPHLKECMALTLYSGILTVKKIKIAYLGTSLPAKPLVHFRSLVSILKKSIKLRLRLKLTLLFVLKLILSIRLLQAE